MLVQHQMEDETVTTSGTVGCEYGWCLYGYLHVQVMPQEIRAQQPEMLP